MRLQASKQHPDWDGLSFAQIAELRKADPWECFFDVLADAGAAYESILVVGTLFTDEHLAEMISHPLFCLGVDTFTTTLEGPLADVLRHPLGYAGHVHYLTHHVRETGTLRLEEAIRKMTSMPAAHFGLWDRGLLRAGYAADVVVFDYDGLDDVSTTDDPHHYARGVEHVLVNGTIVVDGGEHTGARPGRHLLRSMIDLRSDLCSVPTSEMWEAMRNAELGWATVGEDASVNELCERVAELLGKPAAVWVPTCGMANLVAMLTFCEPGDRVVLEAASHVLTSEAMGIVEIARLEPAPLWAPDGRMEPGAVEELVASAEPRCSSSRTRTRGPVGRRCRRS